MMGKSFGFDRDFLKHTNFKNKDHAYTGIETVPDRSWKELPESVIKLLYRIYVETTATNNN